MPEVKRGRTMRIDQPDAVTMQGKKARPMHEGKAFPHATRAEVPTAPVGLALGLKHRNGHATMGINTKGNARQTQPVWDAQPVDNIKPNKRTGCSVRRLHELRKLGACQELSDGVRCTPSQHGTDLLR